nr:PREDICTED: uncharacterized protein LOC109438633 isoform X7 [Rhinolophus sinicus]
MVTMHGSYPTLWSPEDLLLGPTTRLKPAWPEQRQSLTGGAQTGPEHNSWFLTHSPLPVTLLFVFCLLLGVADPHIMSQLEPLRLTGSLATYNLGLAVLSGYISYEFVATLLLANSSYFCQPTDCSPGVFLQTGGHYGSSGRLRTVSTGAEARVNCALGQRICPGGRG